MKLTVLKIQKQTSRYGDIFYYVFMKDDLGKSWKTCAYPKYGNFRRCGWDRVIQQGIGSILEYSSLPINTRGLIDADISFRLYPQVQPKTQETKDENRETVLS